MLRDLRRTVRDALQFFVQSKDELRKREVLARVSVNGHLGDGGGWGLKGKVKPCRVEPIAPTPTSSSRTSTSFQVLLSIPACGDSDPGLGVLLAVVFFLLLSHIPMFRPINLRMLDYMVSVSMGGISAAFIACTCAGRV